MILINHTAFFRGEQSKLICGSHVNKNHSHAIQVFQSFPKSKKNSDDQTID
jgi:hypothetical protein